jgi:hypothetical protein
MCSQATTAAHDDHTMRMLQFDDENDPLLSFLSQRTQEFDGSSAAAAAYSGGAMAPSNAISEMDTDISFFVDQYAPINISIQEKCDLLDTDADELEFQFSAF